MIREPSAQPCRPSPCPSPHGRGDLWHRHAFSLPWGEGQGEGRKRQWPTQSRRSSAAAEFACSAEGCERLDGPPNDIEIDLDKGRMFPCLYSYCDTAPVEAFTLGGGMYAVQAVVDLPEDSGGRPISVIASIDAERGQYTLVRGAGGDVGYTIVGRCSEAD